MAGFRSSGQPPAGRPVFVFVTESSASHRLSNRKTAEPRCSAQDRDAGRDLPGAGRTHSRHSRRWATASLTQQHGSRLTAAQMQRAKSRKHQTRSSSLRSIQRGKCLATKSHSKGQLFTSRESVSYFPSQLSRAPIELRRHPSVQGALRQTVDHDSVKGRSRLRAGQQTDIFRQPAGKVCGCQRLVTSGAPSREA